MINSRRVFLGIALGVLAAVRRLYGQVADSHLENEVRQSLRRAVEFFRDKVARHGGYVYYTSLDLSQRWGEGKASDNTVFVQPPGTPTVGMAILAAYRATRDKFYLEAARKPAAALIKGQSPSGGWPQSFEITDHSELRQSKRSKPVRSSLDDGQTQAALEFLIKLDRALEWKDETIHAAAVKGLDGLLAAQFPNGAFPQSWIAPVGNHPKLQAKYPRYDWRTEGRLKNYWDYYTLNDNLAGSVARTLIVAIEAYGDFRFRDALARLGDFLVAAQMPDPQPAWCQQYNFEMIPIWARKFEPPAIAGSESQDAMETLIEIARQTGKKRYLEPIPRALDYFENNCLLSDGKVARFYEFETNKPLYMTSKYELTYDDSDVPKHYGWKKSQRFGAIRREYELALEDTKREDKKMERPTVDQVKKVLARLDGQGRWVTTAAGENLVGNPKFVSGFQYLSSELFCNNVELLAKYLNDRSE